MLYCSLRPLGPQTAWRVSRVAAITLWCQSWCHMDTGTAREQVASPESGHLAYTLRSFTKGWLPPREEIKRGNDRTKFLSLLKVKRSANVTSKWTLQISVETLVCGWIVGTTPSFDTTKRRDSLWTGLDCPYRDTRARGSRKFSAPQSNNQELDPDKGSVFFHPCAFVRRAVVNTF